MPHIISVDLEDWHQLAYRKVTGICLPATRNVFRQTDALLQLLNDHATRATFFVLGIVVEQFPELVKRIASEGHEIGSHGYAHLTASTLSEEEFIADTDRAIKVTEDLCGGRVRGYRAAQFSIRKGNLWALDALARLGLEYDSSIFPVRHRRYGIPDFAATPARYLLPSGRKIIELPLATACVGRMRLPVAGGGYFRYLPGRLLASCVEETDRGGRPFVTYFHPHEFDSQYLNVADVLPPKGLQQRLRMVRVNLHQNVGRSTVSSKLSVLLKNYTFTTCWNYITGAELYESSTLLRTNC